MRRIVSTTNSGMTTGFAAKQSAPDSDPSRERLLGSPPPELLSHRVELLADQRNGTRVLSRRSVFCTRQPEAPTAKLERKPGLKADSPS